ncbi:peptidoglycan-binding protein [Candidatus Poribacteria bacterium]|nr:peptidoglycan-binding protein [Candidatus Poribacteria bacterium]
MVQEWLALHNFRTAIDGDFGPATERVVKEFQIVAGLPGTGIVDSVTFDRLVDPMKRALNLIPAEGRSLGQMIVAYARQHLYIAFFAVSFIPFPFLLAPFALSALWQALLCRVQVFLSALFCCCRVHPK